MNRDHQGWESEPLSRVETGFGQQGVRCRGVSAVRGRCVVLVPKAVRGLWGSASGQRILSRGVN